MIGNLLFVDLLLSISQGLNKMFTVLNRAKICKNVWSKFGVLLAWISAVSSGRSLPRESAPCGLLVARVLLMWTSRLVSEPIKCARLPPFGICDWQAEHLSLSHIGSIVPCLSVNFAICNNSVRPDMTGDVIIDTDITRIDVHYYVCHPWNIEGDQQLNVSEGSFACLFEIQRLWFWICMQFLLVFRWSCKLSVFYIRCEKCTYVLQKS